MLSEEQKEIGVISASLGNHALALCYHGCKLGIPVTVVMPVVAPIMKIASCRQYGADVIVDGMDMGEAKRIALRQAKEKGLTYINGYGELCSQTRQFSDLVYVIDSMLQLRSPAYHGWPRDLGPRDRGAGPGHRRGGRSCRRGWFDRGCSLSRENSSPSRHDHRE